MTGLPLLKRLLAPPILAPQQAPILASALAMVAENGRQDQLRPELTPKHLDEFVRLQLDGVYKLDNTF